MTFEFDLYWWLERQSSYYSMLIFDLKRFSGWFIVNPNSLWKEKNIYKISERAEEETNTTSVFITYKASDKSYR